MAQQEESEIKIIQTFLPEQMDDAALSAAVKEVVKEAGATSLKDMGKVMGLLKERYAGKMDFSKASAQIKSQLS